MKVALELRFRFRWTHEGTFSTLMESIEVAFQATESSPLILEHWYFLSHCFSQNYWRTCWGLPQRSSLVADSSLLLATLPSQASYCPEYWPHYLSKRADQLPLGRHLHLALHSKVSNLYYCRANTSQCDHQGSHLSQGFGEAIHYQGWFSKPHSILDRSLNWEGFGLSYSTPKHLSFLKVYFLCSPSSTLPCLFFLGADPEGFLLFHHRIRAFYRSC